MRILSKNLFIELKAEKSIDNICSFNKAKDINMAFIEQYKINIIIKIKNNLY